MNFFGHAVVSRQIEQAPGRFPGLAPYALGAMLPDFASMCGGRLEHAGQAPVAAGVALHHRTDLIFHQHRRVLELMSELHERLLRDGCARGPARAGSHIGVELLLDGIFVDDGESCALYEQAVAHEPEPLSWRLPEEAERFAVLRRRLGWAGAPLDLTSPAGVTARLVRTLARRPRLAASSADAACLARGLEALAPRVARWADEILREVVAEVAGQESA